MNRKLKNTLTLVAILILICALGFSFTYFFQKSKIKSKTKELDDLKVFKFDTKELRDKLHAKEDIASIIDSVLKARKFNVPMNITPLRFYDFINQISSKVAEDTKYNIEFIERNSDKSFYFYRYKINGFASFEDFFQIVFAVEQSKELKKIKSLSLTNYVTTKQNLPVFMVNFTLIVDVYFADNDRFASIEYIENKLDARRLYDVFFPLIRIEIPPNVDGLLDVQTARLLALVSEGAFLTDASQKSFLLAESDPVYLGYLTKIDFQQNKVRFVLNKGGIVETVELGLDKEVKEIKK